MTADDITPERLRELAAAYAKDAARHQKAGNSGDRDWCEETAAALRAAADRQERDERDRDARAADIERWMAILGEHLSPHQEEALTVIDIALAAYVSQRAILAAAREALLRRADELIEVGALLARTHDSYEGDPDEFAVLAAEIAAALEPTND